MPENVFPTPTPPLPSRFRFLIAVPGPSKGLSCHLAGLARPPRLLPGPGLARVSRKRVAVCLQVRPEVGCCNPHASSGFGAALPWQVSLAVSAGSQSAPDPRYYLMGKFRNGSSFPVVLPSNSWAQFCLFWHRSDESPDQCFWSWEYSFSLWWSHWGPRSHIWWTNSLGFHLGPLPPNSLQRQPKSPEWLEKLLEIITMEANFLTQPTIFQWETVHLTPVETSTFFLMSTCLCK